MTYNCGGIYYKFMNENNAAELNIYITSTVCINLILSEDIFYFIDWVFSC